MPYRAMLFTLVTFGLAFVVLSMWVSAIEPYAAQVQAQSATANATKPPATNPHADAIELPDKKFRGLVKGILYLSFLLICIILLIGIAASFRQWMLYSTRRKKIRTTYVNAWEIAGQRMQAAPPEDDPPSEETDPES